MKRLRYLLIILVVVAIPGFLLCGCASKQTDTQTAMEPSKPDGPMSGPGLFTREEDGITIFKR